MSDDEEKTRRLTDGSSDIHSSSPVAHGKRSAASVLQGTANAHARRSRRPGLCDGNNPCARCTEHEIANCAYEAPLRQSKDSLRKEIDELRRQLEQKDTILSALVEPNSSEDVLARLLDGQSVDGASRLPDHTLDSEEDAALPDVDSDSFLTTSQPKQPSYEMAALLGKGLGETAMIDGIEERDQVGRAYLQDQPQSTDKISLPDVFMWTASMASYFRVSPRLLSEQVLSGMADHSYMDQMSIPIPLSNMGMLRGTWTSITGDTGLVQHLLALYFCWEYPTFTTIHKEYFLVDFLSGRQKYCSEGLVNALLALGCLLSSRVGIATSLDDPQTLSDQFFKESLRITAQATNQYSLTTIQAFCILSIRQARCGKNVESRYYAGQSMRLAVEMGLHQVGYDRDEGDMAVSAAAFWGAFTLDNAWSLVMGLLPLSSRAPLLPSRLPTNADIEAAPWTPYPTEDTETFSGHLKHPYQQASNTQSVFGCFCEISQMGHNTAYLLQTPDHPVTAYTLLDTYTRYLDWYDKIPEVLRLGTNFTPAVLLVHIYYHCVILLLFRPFIRLRIDKSSVLPRDICTEAADAIRGLLRSYSQLYTLRRTPSFLPYLTLISATMHLTAATVRVNEGSPKGTSSNMPTVDIHRAVATVPLDFAELAEAISTTAFRSNKLRSELDLRVTDALTQGINDLTEMMQYNHSAEGALHVLQHLCALWKAEEAETPFPASFHVQGQFTAAPGPSLEEAGFSML
ncbi:fungal-specific transcription factor domain-containing protein [Apiospora phragmitis]|uniref:Fungal-specific transcription factor domain-containing protein n=1 Tax=Apiospora phragmitis TaxID=2905665 RepID=A0ABR1SUH5_9PEZI